MKDWLPILGRSLGSLAILGLAIAGFILMGKADVPKQPIQPERPPIVDSVLAAAHTEGISFDVDGVVVPFRQVQIAAQVAGRVAYKSDNCRIGQIVQKGELLLRVDPADYELEVHRLTQELLQAEAMIKELLAEIESTDNQIASSKSQLEIDVRQLRRNQDLLKRRAASDTEVDASKRSELTSRNSLQSLVDQRNLLVQREARMESAMALVQANLDKASLSLGRTEIFSPMDAVVVTESVEQDGFVQTGSPMIVLQDTSRLDVACKLKMQQMNWLWQGRPRANETLETDHGGDRQSSDRASYDFPDTPATVIYRLAGEDYAWTGMVDRYDGASVDTQTRMVPCRVHVRSPDDVSKYQSEFFGPISSLPNSAQSNSAQSNSAQSSSIQSSSTEAASKTLATSLEKDSEGELDSPDSLAGEIVRSNRLANPPTLMSGMFVKVRIHANPPIPLVRLPQQAIQPGNKVWVISDGVLRRKDISVATSTPDYVVAYQQAGGLQTGDKVVVSPLATPVEGMPVRSLADAENADNPKKNSGRPRGTRS